MKRAAVLASVLVVIAAAFTFATIASPAALSIGSSKDRSMSAPPYGTITAHEAKRIMSERDVFVVDVRPKVEYDEARIAGALSAPFNGVEFEENLTLPKDGTPILVYCRTGVRSKQAAEKLVAMGYRNVFDLGGIRDWPYETEHS